MQIDSSTAASTLAPVATPVQAPAPVEPPEQDDAVQASQGRAADHALFQGNGNKTGIIKRLSTDEILAVREELGIKAGQTADRIVAEREQQDATEQAVVVAEAPPADVAPAEVEIAADVPADPLAAAQLPPADPEEQSPIGGGFVIDGTGLVEEAVVVPESTSLLDALNSQVAAAGDGRQAFAV